MIDLQALPTSHQQILHYLAQGLTAKEMSEKMSVPVRTINFHLQVLYNTFNLPPGKNRFIKLLIAAGYIQDKNPIE
jgi:DNA-binding NarL/FixJ family response regulator